ncbi:contractile injection system protein, VgrG/Pvc8 family [Variovorax sp. J22P168]|uniref:phage late control D family protein n=1 Tax=Variovorax jilinensis TaxID=3053513 RepID=UPI002578F0C8|nr:contractile injection system protein, VgrG/Pvc8 family [Variovorax sp. J22P168]MDM0011739.1 contractile injection system protein, VgrG/Pvc8 family [Variovorax sp. J22P168]
MAETSLSQSAIFSARPVVHVGGQAVERVSALLSAMRMEESEGGMSTLELRLSNWVATGGGGAELAFDGQSPLRLGAELLVGTGDEAAPNEIFRGKVSALEMVCSYGQPPELVVLAEDALTAARRARRTKVYADMSPAEVIRAVAGNLALSPTVTGLDAPHGTWVQLDETDLGFLRRLAARFEADLQVSGTALAVAPRQEVQRGTIELTLNSQLARVRITADLADQVTAVTAAGWNPADGSPVSGSATGITHGGPGSGRSGLAWAEEVFGARSEHLGNPVASTDAEAQALAEAALDQRARRFVRAEGTAEGNARMRVGAQVRLAGISAQFDNSYYVIEARHLFDMRQGYRTEFRAECAYLGN